jgi:hypothetical protein
LSQLHFEQKLFEIARGLGYESGDFRKAVKHTAITVEAQSSSAGAETKRDSVLLAVL